MKNQKTISLALLLALAGCGSDDHTADQHHVFFVGYVYDGARQMRLTAKDLTAISIKYRDQIIHTNIEPDGRFVTVEPLPTWQDYAVYIGAPGYRPFVSRNPGIDVPKSLAMTDGLATTATTQTFQYDAYLFPMNLQAPAVDITVQKADALSTTPTPDPAAGTLRLRPISSSLLEGTGYDPTSGLPVATGTSTRRWANDEDLLNRTVTKSFTDGKVQVAAGELAYGVPYQVAVFDVKDYQPLVGSQTLVAGVVTSRAFTVVRELKEPLHVISTDNDKCTLPAGNATDYGAKIDITFSEDIELVGATWAEDIDNGVAITPTGSAPPAPGSYSSSYYCALKSSTDPNKQERGTQVTVQGSVLTLAFNPSIGLSNMGPYAGYACVVPTVLTSVIYGNLSAVMVSPKGDPSRKRTLAAMLVEASMTSGTTASYSTNAISCPAHLNSPYGP